MKTTLIALLSNLAVASFLPARAVCAADQLDETPPVVRLFLQDKPVQLPDAAQSRVRQQLTGLVKASNFHSGVGDHYHLFTSSGVQQDYRDAVAAGEYLLMIFSPAQKIETLSGDVSVAEIVVGLRSPNGRNCLFTIDESGTIVSHAKYSAEILLDLKKTVGQLRP